MPGRFRKRRWSPVEIPGGPAVAGGSATAFADEREADPQTPPWWRDRSWASAPAALVAVDAERVLAWNDEARDVLSRALGGGADTWRRWLEAAWVRLRIQGADREVLAASGNREMMLEVRSGPADEPEGVCQLALRPLRGDDRRAADLVETISTLSHEFRTPLAAMKSSLNLVHGGEAGPLGADQRRFLGMTLRNIDRLDRLVRDLLDVARADAGKLPLHLRETDLGPILADAAAMHRTAAEEAGLRLNASALPESFVAHTDPDKILQMLANVVGNAIKYCEPGDRIGMDFESGPLRPETAAGDLARRYGLPAECFTLIVQDTGPGIDEDKLEAAFEPFNRVHDESGGRAFGAGLGLYITRGLVEAHSGRISLAGEKGKGTTVRILLPADPESARLLRAERLLAAWNETAEAVGEKVGHMAAILDFRSVPQAATHATAVLQEYLDDDGGAGDAAPRIEIAPGLWAAWLPRERAADDAWHGWLVARGETVSWAQTGWEPVGTNWE